MDSPQRPPRSSIRHQLHLPVSLKLANKELYGRSENISSNGILLSSAFLIPEGSSGSDKRAVGIMRISTGHLFERPRQGCMSRCARSWRLRPGDQDGSGFRTWPGSEILASEGSCHCRTEGRKWLIIAILAVFIGPLISWHIAKRQIESPANVANRQIPAPMRQEWINGLKVVHTTSNSNTISVECISDGAVSDSATASAENACTRSPERLVLNGRTGYLGVRQRLLVSDVLFLFNLSLPPSQVTQMCCSTFRGLGLRTGSDECSQRRAGV